MAECDSEASLSPKSTSEVTAVVAAVRVPVPCSLVPHTYFVGDEKVNHCSKMDARGRSREWGGIFQPLCT